VISLVAGSPDNALGMADALAIGLVQQLPKRFR
jgi:hypothetical protein